MQNISSVTLYLPAGAVTYTVGAGGVTAIAKTADNSGLSITGGAGAGNYVNVPYSYTV